MVWTACIRTAICSTNQEGLQRRLEAFLRDLILWFNCKKKPASSRLASFGVGGLRRRFSSRAEVYGLVSQSVDRDHFRTGEVVGEATGAHVRKRIALRERHASINWNRFRSM